MKLQFLTGSRSEWGYIKPILKICKKKRIKYSICATNMHLLSNYGLSIQEIKKDGFKVDFKIFMSLEGGNHYTMTKSMAIFQISFTPAAGRTIISTHKSKIQQSQKIDFC